MTFDYRDTPEYRRKMKRKRAQFRRVKPKKSEPLDYANWTNRRLNKLLRGRGLIIKRNEPKMTLVRRAVDSDNKVDDKLPLAIVWDWHDSSEWKFDGLRELKSIIKTIKSTDNSGEKEI